MAEEPKIRIESREELIYLLTEAAAIEHNLMCCYLYAAWSLKRGERDGLTKHQAEAVTRWKRAIVSVAIEEMTHLTLASNLMSSIGGSPYLSRPNFPIPPGYHPSGVVVELARFSRPVLDHFIFLERPEGKELQDSSEFVHPTEYHRTQPHGRLMPHAQDYGTVGHLYRGIRHGMEVLAHHIGQDRLFCGDPASQIGPGDASLPGLQTVTDLATAEAAIETIIEQGEGAPDHSEDSHYSRFLRVRREYDEFLEADPKFDPAFPVAHNPVMRLPRDPQRKVYISNLHSARILDFANALYTHMLRSLVQAFGRGADGEADKRMFVNAAIDMMEALAQVGPHLASLPAGEEHPGINAGVTFTMLRDVARLPLGSSEKRTMAERVSEIARHARHLFPAGHELSGLAAQLDKIVAGYGVPDVYTVGGKHEIATPPPDATPPPVKHDDLPSGAGEPCEIAPGKNLSIRFDGHRCIHARFCVLGAPSVFRANTPGTWIYPDAAPLDTVLQIAHDCPSGAIQYTRHDGGPPEEAPAVNVANIRENGPYAFRGDLKLAGHDDIGFRATLCRCGASKRKPYCDGSHNEIKFRASGEPDTRPSEPLKVRNGPVEISPQQNGPLQVRGNLEICTGTGRTVDRVGSVRLCRCGGSRTKPFCDNTHLKIGFQAAGE